MADALITLVYATLTVVPVIWVVSVTEMVLDAGTMATTAMMYWSIAVALDPMQIGGDGQPQN